MTDTQQLLEVHLEEAGERSWLAALANTLIGSYGSAQFRFVARPPGKAGERRVACVFGATFPVMRAQDLDVLHEPNAWIDTARERLEELDRQLRDEGWTPVDRARRHWWSRSYAR